jgi:hypothetical protein
MATREYWEFLLQQEGDESWVPLDASNDAIASGTYRIIARSSYPNAELEVRMTHAASQENPPKRRTKKRPARTNEDGFVLVLPFTPLAPGNWEFVCRSNAENWEKAVHLTVLVSSKPGINADFGLTDFGRPSIALLPDRSALLLDADDFAGIDLSMDASSIALSPQGDRDGTLVPDWVSSSDPASDSAVSFTSDDDAVLSLAELDQDWNIAPIVSEVAEVDLVELEFTDADAFEIAPIDDTPIESLDTEFPAIDSSFAVVDSFDATPIDLVFEAPPAILPPAILPPAILPPEILSPEILSPEILSPQAVPPETLPGVWGITKRKTPDTDTSPVAEAAAIAEIALMPLPKVTIELQPSMYSFCPGQTLMVYGQVTPAHLPATIGTGELVVRLINPQTASPVAEFRQPLQQQSLPFAIAATLPLGIDLTGQLLIGEVTIWNDGVEELAQETFTAMADVDAIIAAIDPELNPATFERAPKVKVEEHPLPAVDFSFFNLIGAAPTDAPEPALTIKRESLKDVDLPDFWETDVEAMAIADEDANSELFDEASLNLEGITNDLLAHADPVPEPAAPEPAAPEPAPPEPAAPEDVVIEEKPIALADFDFDLDVLQEEALLEEVIPEEVILEGVIPEEIFILPLTIDPIVSEVVVDDLPETLPTPKNLAPTANPLLVPDQEEIPTPTIDVEAGELITGQAIRVKVKLPDILPKIYVKLWINDRQSRTLLDGPRWLVDFLPNGRGELEASTQLTVPFGSLEIQIAAIAVEASTKRESYRTSIDRTVIPPNMEDDLADLVY